MFYDKRLFVIISLSPERNLSGFLNFTLDLVNIWSQLKSGTNKLWNLK